MGGEEGRTSSGHHLPARPCYEFVRFINRPLNGVYAGRRWGILAQLPVGLPARQEEVPQRLTSQRRCRQSPPLLHTAAVWGITGKGGIHVLNDRRNQPPGTVQSMAGAAAEGAW